MLTHLGFFMYMIDPSAMQLLVPLYNSPQRHYHDLNHIYFSLAKLSEYMETKSDGDICEDIVKYAIWFHDAIYSPFPFSGKNSNERESANLFQSCIDQKVIKIPDWDASYGCIFEDAVHQAIRATEFHLDHNAGLAKEHTYPTTHIMLDIDMAGFGNSFDRVYADSDKIFKEYSVLRLPEAKMLEARVDFLKKVLEKPRIYYTEYFYDTYEAKARDNIEGVIELSQ